MCNSAAQVRGRTGGPLSAKVPGAQRRVRDDERVEDHHRITEAHLDLLDRLMEANLPDIPPRPFGITPDLLFCSVFF